MENQTLPYGLGALWAGAGASYSWKGICGCASKVTSPGDRQHEIYWWVGPDGSRVLMKWYSLASSNSLGCYAEAFNPSTAVDLLDAKCFTSKYNYGIAGAYGRGWDALKTLTNQFVTVAKSKTNARRRADSHRYAMHKLDGRWVVGNIVTEGASLVGDSQREAGPAGGNWEGKTILQRALDDSSLAAHFRRDTEPVHTKLTQLHARLLEARSTRVRPGTDDKVLVMWYALAVMAFAEAGRYLNRPDYVDAAVHNARFLLENLYDKNRLYRSWREGQAKQNAYLEDYAGLVLALLALRLGSVPLLGPDEPRYARVAVEMQRASEWVTPTLQGEPWLEKPPLYYWLAGAAFRALGETEAAARVPSVLALLLLTGATALFGARLYGSAAGLHAGFVAGTSLLPFAYGRAASMDMLLAATVTVAIGLSGLPLPAKAS